jgi:hypothetical protein
MTVVVVENDYMDVGQLTFVVRKGPQDVVFSVHATDGSAAEICRMSTKDVPSMDAARTMMVKLAMSAVK